jgi:hypothetical protein
MNTTFCLAEDRHGAEIGIKLALLSLAEHCPGCPVVLFRPVSAPGFVEWTRQFPGVRVVEKPLAGATNWNCKPHALLELLGDIAPDDQLVWLDSDILLTRDPRPMFAAADPAALVVAVEAATQPSQGTGIRTRGWDLPVGREFPRTFNSCVLRVRPAHAPLLRRWKELLGDPRYLAVASIPTEQKPPHLWSDQDVLNALLGSAEFSALPVVPLAHARDVLHTGGALGFTLGERLRGLFLPVPTVLHAIAGKPWVLMARDPKTMGRFERFRALMQETSPFVAHCRRYRGRVAEPTRWLDYRSVPGTLLRIAGLGHWAFRGLPVTLACTVAKRLGLLR